MSASDNYRRIVDNVRELALKVGRKPEDIAIIAVSKTHPMTDVKQVFDAGCRHFGESRVQEALPKIIEGPKDIRWHLIGSLQKNKINKVIGRFGLIHSVDNLELAEAICKASVERGVVTPLLLQVNTSGEASKHGLSPAEWVASMEQTLLLPGIEIQGLMTMAPLDGTVDEVRYCFAALRQYKERIEQQYGVILPHLSMGMSHDYPIAIAEGATLLRIGTAIFSGA